MSKQLKEKQLDLYKNAGVMKTLLERLSDTNADVSRTAAGALRNIARAGGLDMCEYLVHEDALTPLLSLLHKISSRLKSALVEQHAVHLQSVIALINHLCESCGQAVMLLIDSTGAVQCVLDCLQPGILPDELVVAAASLLHVVSDQNEMMVTHLLTTDNAIQGFYQLISNTQVPTAVRLHLAATLMNVHQISNQLSSSLQQIIAPVVGALAFDVQAALQQAAQAGSQAAAVQAENKAKKLEEAKKEEAEKKKGKGKGKKGKKAEDGSASMDTDQAAEAEALTAGIKAGTPGEFADDDEDDGEKPGDAIDAQWKLQIEPVVLALEILTNLCVGVYDEDEEGEGEWEDVDDDMDDAEAVGGEEAPAVTSAVQEVLTLVSQSTALQQVLQLVGQFNFCVASAATDSDTAGAGAAGGAGMAVPLHLRPSTFGKDTQQAHHRACCCLQNMVGNFPFETLNGAGGGAGVVGMLGGLCDQAVRCKTAAHSARTQSFASPSGLDGGAAAASSATSASVAPPTAPGAEGAGAGSIEGEGDGGNIVGESGESVLSSLLSVLWAGLRRCLENCSESGAQQQQGASLPLSGEHQQFISLLTSAEHCSCESTRQVAVGIMGALGRFPPPYLPLGAATAAQRGQIGSVLLAALSDSSLLVITEALNAVYDVYADVEHNDVFAALGFVEHLEALAPQLTAKIAAESKEMDPDARAEFKEARFNLKRFTKYKRSEARA
jgi:hypothetical protein